MTKNEYLDYQERVERFFKNEGIDNLTTVDSEEEPDFSWARCDCCKRHIGGNRYLASGYNPTTEDIQEYEVCQDCIYYAEYGQLDDQSMMDIGKSEE